MKECNCDLRDGDAKTAVFGSNEMLQPAPVDTIPMEPTTPQIAYQMVKDETFAQTQPRLNLATFVTTYMDDMYMITTIQAQAYRVTNDRKYIDRAAREMVLYLDSIQQPSGLFYHAPTAPFCWGRGNGWMAAGMSELLRMLPQDNPDRAEIMKGYLKMMEKLKDTQDENGM